MLISLESGGLEGAELDKATEAGWMWRWRWGMVGEADKSRGGERERGRVYLQSAPESVKGGIMSDVFPASTFRHSHCH